MSNNEELVYLNSDGDDSDSAVLETEIISKEETAITEDYEPDSSELDDDEGSLRIDEFRPVLNTNVFVTGAHESVMVLIGLNEKQTIHLSGIFNLQVVKGGIVYNGVHYNASREYMSFSHPLTNAIPEIKASYHAGWDEPLYLTVKDKKLVDMNSLDKFVCMLKVTICRTNGLLDLGTLYPDANSLWVPKTNNRNSKKADFASFSILDGIYQDEFISQKNPADWQTVIDNLFISFKNQEYDMRIMVIGGKNSGKSTILRVLQETFMNKTILNDDGTTFKSQEDILYMDLDPGQPEYSDPECISLTQISPTQVPLLGQHLAQTSYIKLQQHYYGSSSPQDEPSLYLEQINDLMKYFEERESMGTTLLNLPGWIKGFGMTIVNSVIRLFKPTHIICIDPSKLDSELQIPPEFSNPFQLNYKPVIYNINSISSHSKLTQTYQPRFNAIQIRTTKMLMALHRMRSTEFDQLKYDFTPLLLQRPIRISLGSGSGIHGIQFQRDLGDLGDDNIRGALEGTIVGLLLRREWINVENENVRSTASVTKFPVIREKIKASNLTYYSIALIHSINIEENFMNLYIPQANLDKMIEKTKTMNNQNSNDINNCKYTWFISRGKSDTPFCEIYPNRLKTMFEKYEQIPYVSTERRKKHEHVWKVRKNVQRRGHFMK
ncbi:Polynucleotide 5'-hydroxyl-kinase grc3 [Maudiozyma exigua]|uniref:Polynucleotide 5'-hydroxyl-kinase GRC3 n=1 Tax=Maudiozyma exigua TaxID=34358 RepID=A0A9P6WAG6_MAUEX|nr:Polynucleotide 5'-hydroxyl-kinase grc3 [Kazachstania exigua]